MANTTNQSHLEQFESYFERADVDRDGRISGGEAVSFFQGSGLPKPVLAQIWNFADQNRAGFLGRQEFFNALKLVTVAQSKRDLTPDIVKAALYGPASSKIPPPQINLPQTPAAQSHPVAASPGMQMGAMAPTASQNPGYRGPVPLNPNMNQQYFPSPGNQYPRPSQGYPSNMGPRATESTPGLLQSSISSSGLIPGQPNSGILTPGFSGSMPTRGFQSSGMTPPGPLSSGMPTPGLPSSGMLTPGLPSSGMLTPGLPISGMPTPGLPSSGMPTHSRLSSGFATPGLPSSGMSTLGLPSSGVSTDWLGGRTSGAPSVATSQVSNRGATPTPAPEKSFSSNSTFSSDSFAAFQTISKPSASFPAASSAIVPVSVSSPASSTPTSSALVPASFATQPSTMSNSLDSLQSPLVKQPVGGQHQQAQTFSSLSQSVRPVTSAGVSPGISVGSGNSASDQSQAPWPKMTAAGIQKYSKVFMEVDTDRDGKITGEQAHNLFLSWRLPREVLKQVWDLSDQDSDSMLSLREFCVALYLMERYREGHSLPASLPNSVMLDETLMRMTGVPNSSHGNAAWGASPATGLRPVQGVPASQGVAPAAGLRPGMQSVSRADGTMQSRQPKSSSLLLDESQSSLLDDGQKLQQPSSTESNDAEKKVEKVEKVILDSREKLEFYRTKMQELVLYKSRCDNRLNEIIERASADKREAELLGKKYEEKYKQVAELASKLTIEEAEFREYQERKMELHQAIINMEQGGSVDGLLQVRADRVHSDFEELLKALTERCKKHGIEIKSAASIELPKGWQPGIQEGAAVWDEEWDKFEDEGLIFDKEINIDAQNANGSPKSTLFQNGTYPHEDGFSPDSPSNTDVKSEKHFSGGERAFDGESRYAHSEDGSNRSPHGSPAHRAAPESPSRFSDVFAKSEADTDFHRSFDDHVWGTFDGTDDVDSVWGFNSKDEQHGDCLFEPSGFSSSPRTDSPHRDNMYNRNNSPFNFADSVPGTPYSKSVNSPRYSEAGDNLFDNYSRFDSFSMSDSTRFSPPKETISSSRSGFSHSRAFTSFDDADPFGSTGPFKVSSETSKKGSDNWSSF